MMKAAATVILLVTPSTTDALQLRPPKRTVSRREALLAGIATAASLSTLLLPHDARAEDETSPLLQDPLDFGPIDEQDTPSTTMTESFAKADGGLTKGTQAMADTSALLSSIDAFYQHQPYASAFLTCSVKGAAADLLAQKQSDDEKKRRVGDKQVPQSWTPTVENESSSFDAKRNMAFVLYAGLYQGMALHYFYNGLFHQLFGNDIFLKVFASMFILAPLVTLPVAYLIKAAVFRKPIEEAFQNYIDDIQHQGLLLKFWIIWIPVQTAAFAIVPEHWRITFLALVSFLWMILFSSISSNKEEQEQQA